jgi:phosphoglycerate kinase
MMKQTVEDIDVRGRRVLVRADFNVPLQDGQVADDSRIRAALPTIAYLLAHEASVIVCSHLGRPGGRVVKRLSLRPVAERLSALLGVTVDLAPSVVGRKVETRVAALAPGQVLMLENVRFHRDEETNGKPFAERLAKLADVYVNDAFGVAHRAHASTEGVARLLPSVAGLLMAKELEALSGALDGDGRTAVVSGGAKVSDKLALLRTVVDKADVLCVGGAMANTFLLAQGVEVGKSLAERGMVEEARAILAAAEGTCEVVLPVDCVIAEGPDQPPRARPLLFEEESVPQGWAILDVGPKTVGLFLEALKGTEVVIWNGPLGLFERQAFSGATRELARKLVELEARTIVCGGETVQAVREAGVADAVTHLSTGGGAALELLEGRSLPGVAALSDVAEGADATAGAKAR